MPLAGHGMVNYMRMLEHHSQNELRWLEKYLEQSKEIAEARSLNSSSVLQSSASAPQLLHSERSATPQGSVAGSRSGSSCGKQRKNVMAARDTYELQKGSGQTSLPRITYGKQMKGLDCQKAVIDAWLKEREPPTEQQRAWNSNPGLPEMKKFGSLAKQLRRAYG
eukprot:gnl/MRDRNA2_/MRDRNA2_95438_c0_seq1.p1 gnl/MRDRNA2_/MRDRNA2_95438_c0~~gnl/MRDRNA2_/MRDRNA2_95438_c0_seq1.p1  ORF type:complete len:165 (+),score=30.71 gnl/MRDRNA2_/MRDRNA2_95438_c0_seq1:110-604(+)